MNKITNPIGIGGWLMLPALGLIFSPLIGIWQFYIGYQMMASFGLDFIDRPAFVALAIVDIGMVIFAIVVACYFFRRHRATLVLFPAFLIAKVLADILMGTIMSQLFDVPFEFMPAARSVIIAIIGILYFSGSKRVRNTFAIKQNIGVCHNAN